MQPDAACCAPGLRSRPRRCTGSCSRTCRPLHLVAAAEDPAVAEAVDGAVSPAASTGAAPADTATIAGSAATAAADNTLSAGGAAGAANAVSSVPADAASEDTTSRGGCSPTTFGLVAARLVGMDLPQMYFRLPRPLHAA
jgi:hypothetical protein